MWAGALACEAEDAESDIRADAKRLLALTADNAEYYTEHLNAAVSALRLFGFAPRNEDGPRAIQAQTVAADLKREVEEIETQNPAVVSA